jgi:hypothetical protein
MPGAANSQGASGLGLATAQAVVSDHGGRISAESAPGSGTTFRLEFAAAPAGVVAPPQSPAAAVSPQLRAGAVLPRLLPAPPAPEPVPAATAAESVKPAEGVAVHSAPERESSRPDEVP